MRGISRELIKFLGSKMPYTQSFNELILTLWEPGFN